MRVYPQDYLLVFAGVVFNCGGYAVLRSCSDLPDHIHDTHPHGRWRHEGSAEEIGDMV